MQIFCCYRFRIYIKKPATGEHTLSELLKPLSMNLWRAIFIAMVVTSLVLTALWKALNKHEADSYDLQSSAFYVLGAFCQRGEKFFTKQFYYSYNKASRKLNCLTVTYQSQCVVALGANPQLTHTHTPGTANSIRSKYK